MACGVGGPAGIVDRAGRLAAGLRATLEVVRTPCPAGDRPSRTAGPRRPVPGQRKAGRGRFRTVGEGCATITIARSEIRQFIDA